MRYGFARLAALTLVVLTGACASQAFPDNMRNVRLSAGATVAPPDGLLDYCQRQPRECGQLAGASLRGTFQATGMTTTAVNNAAPSGVSHGAAPSLFHALLTARMTASSSAPRRREVSLTETRWRELRAVNRSINRAIRAVTDREAYGQEEFWAAPLSGAPSTFAPSGDCEDFALEKRARLIALGWDADSVALAVAIVPQVGLHAMLIVQTDRGDIVLDNLTDAPLPLAEVDYVWVSRQVGPDLGQWAGAQPTHGAVEAQSVVQPTMTLERRFHQLIVLAANDSALAPVPVIAAPAFQPSREPAPAARPPLGSRKLGGVDALAAKV